LIDKTHAFLFFLLLFSSRGVRSLSRLFGFGVGIHLLEAEDPENMTKKTEINPKDNHISFQVKKISAKGIVTTLMYSFSAKHDPIF